ncbi:O-antigen ligase family protein [Allochromatium vinosum]|uniref:O-antigen ligase family protein n=1 Tax=Allochromatium vinosum TaxID=1049 RepID=UPI001904ABDA|nr:O-antigen ligase family protein [Allochromatium vinosum]MBK1654995.1 hypothetical protein [Allochromatium vinosum]
MSSEGYPLNKVLRVRPATRAQRAPRMRRLGAGLLARAALLGLTVGMVLLVLFDWLYDFEIIAVPLALFTRATLLAVFAIYLVQTGVNFGAYGFRFGKILFYFLGLNLVYTAFSGDILGNLYHTSRIAFWILAAVVAYRLALSGALTEKILQRAIGATVFLGAAFTIYFMTQGDTEAGQNASAYLLLWCLPLLLLSSRSSANIMLLALAAVAILLTVKRGAMIGLGLSSVAYALAYMKLHGNARAFARMLGIAVVLGAVGAYALSQNWEAVETRFEDTSGSGRDKMYAGLYEHWIHAEPLNVAFGFGINSVQQYTPVMFGSNKERGPYAHSDWIQMMHDFGLLGIGFLVWLHAQFLSLIRRSYRIRHPYTPALAMGYVTLFLVNIYSGHLMSPGAVYCGLLLAFSAAVVDRSTPLAKRSGATRLVQR